MPQQPQQPQPAPYPTDPYSPTTQKPYPQADYPRGPAGQATAQQTSGVLYNSSQPPVNPVFGVTLEELFRRDGSPVPMVVYQCIQAVDLYGLEVEGIYRIPGTSSHIQQMKALFDSGMLYGRCVLVGRTNAGQMRPRLISAIRSLSSTTSTASQVC